MVVRRHFRQAPPPS